MIGHRRQRVGGRWDGGHIMQCTRDWQANVAHGGDAPLAMDGCSGGGEE